jgi:hypothetical protein
MSETGKPHLKKLFMIKHHIVAFIKLDPGELRGFRAGPLLNSDHPCNISLNIRDFTLKLTFIVPDGADPVMACQRKSTLMLFPLLI